MFDANLILLDGTVDIDDAVAASHVPAISASSRPAASGAIVLDIKETGVNGISAVLIMPTLTSSTDYVIALIEVSDSEDMTGAADDVHEVGKFDIAAVTKGRILASECTAGAVAILRFATDKRYIRLNIAPTVGTSAGNMGAIKCYLAPFAFKVL